MLSQKALGCKHCVRHVEMPDICMCVNKSCQLKGDCYRAMATPNSMYQSYTMFKCEDGKCNHFIKFKKGDNLG